MSQKAAEEQQLLMKVIVLQSRSARRIVYLECGNDFTDLLLTLLTLPVGKILKLLSIEAQSLTGLRTGTIPGIFNLHSSVETLEQSALNVPKTVLTDPESPSSLYFFRTSRAVMHRCLNTAQCSNFTTFKNQLCKSCMCLTYQHCQTCVSFHQRTVKWNLETGTLSWVSCGHEEEHPLLILHKKSDRKKSSAEEKAQVQDQGFAEETMTFLINEDLSIEKSSTTTSIAWLTRANIRTQSFEDVDTKEMLVGRIEVDAYAVWVDLRVCSAVLKRCDEDGRRS